MPVYDVQCSACGFAGTATIKIQDLNNWDQAAQCPGCQQGRENYRRVIRMAPSSPSGARPQSQFKSSERDDMRHREFLRRNPDQIAAAVESVRKGEFES